LATEWTPEPGRKTFVDTGLGSCGRRPARVNVALQVGVRRASL